MKYLIHHEGDFSVVTAEAIDGLLFLDAPTQSNSANSTTRVHAEIFLRKNSIPAPQSGLIFDKLLTGDFNFTETQVSQLLSYAPFFAQQGYHSLVRGLFKHSPEHNIWSYANVQQSYGYNDFWNSLLNDERDIADKFGENGIFPRPGAALYGDDFLPIGEAIKRRRNQSTTAALHVFKGKQFFRSMLRRVFPAALVASNMEMVRKILLLAKDEQSARYDHFAQNLVMQDNHLALAFAVATEQPELLAVLKEYATPDIQILSDLSRRPKLRRLVEEYKNFDLSSMPAIEQKPALIECNTPFKELNSVVKPLDGVVLATHPFFSQAVYDDILPAMQLMAHMTAGYAGEEISYKLSILFDNVVDARKVVETLSANGGQSIGYKLGFNLPESSTWNPALWRRAILEHTDNALELIRKVEEIGDTLGASEQLWMQEDIIFQCAEDNSFAPLARAMVAHEIQDASHDWIMKFWHELANENPSDAIKYLGTISGIAKEHASLQNQLISLNLPLKELTDLTRQDVMSLVVLVHLRQTDEDRYQKVRSLFVKSMEKDADAGCLQMLQSLCTMGVEIEMFGLDMLHLDLMDKILGNIQPGWVQGEDGSIEPDDGTEGVEMVSPILRSQDVKNMRFVAQTMKSLGAKVAGRCALHIHVGIIKIFPKTDRLPVIKQALLNYLSLEQTLSFMDGELTDKYSDVFAKQNLSVEQAVEKIINAPDVEVLMDLTQPKGRQGGRINLHALAKHGTLEFRQHPGTVEPAEVTAWMRFVDRFMHITVEMAQSGLHVPTQADVSRLESLVDDYIIDRDAGDHRREQSSILGIVSRSRLSAAQMEAVIQ